MRRPRSEQSARMERLLAAALAGELTPPAIRDANLTPAEARELRRRMMASLLPEHRRAPIRHELVRERLGRVLFGEDDGAGFGDDLTTAERVWWDAVTIELMAIMARAFRRI